MSRPKKTIKHLQKNWKALVIKEYRVGASNQEVKATLGISNDLWTRLMNEDKEFSETIKEGQSYSEAWWMKQGRVYLTKPGFNATLWYMNMKNRFGWRDRPEEAPKGQQGFSLVAILDKAKKVREAQQREGGVMP